jgi:predicted ATPase
MVTEQSRTAAAFWQRLSEEATEALESPAFQSYLEEHRGELDFRGVVDRRDLPTSIEAALEYARRWFQSRVRHLGPLRAEPQPLHGLPEAASGTSVGRSGEYTAAVLSAHRNRLIVSPDPTGSGSRELRLQDAVNEWMASMQLLSSVHAEERGKLGYELHLSVEGVRRDLDLTTVGVGVSQALPVVVLGLITPPGSLLLFEQPELHLHPDVQASLGDFFLALARSGRQLVVETHSEYLVNRLRRRAATDPSLGAERLTRLFFFERTGDSSDVRAVRIGAGGTMPGWPRGFLDTAAREIEAMAHGYQS